MSGNLDSFLLGSDFSMIEVHFFHRGGIGKLSKRLLLFVA